MYFPKIIKNSALYFASSFFQMGLGIFMLPIYTYYLSPKDYGTLSVITTITAFLTQAFLLSMHVAASRFHFNSKSLEYQRKVWGTLLLVAFTNSLFWSIFLFIFHRYIIDPLAQGINFYPMLFWAIVGTLLSPAYTFYQQWLKTIQDGISYTLNSISYLLLSVFLTILLLVVLRKGVMSIILSNLIVSGFFFLFSLYKYIPITDLNFDKTIAKDAIKYALPIIPHGILGYWSTTIDRLILNIVSGPRSVGYYSIAGQLGGAMSVITTSINMAFSPWFYQIVSDNNSNYERIYIFSDLSVLIYCIFAFLISIFSPEVIFVLTSDAYLSSWMPVSFICFSGVARGMYYFFCQPLFYSHTKYIVIVSFASLLANVGLNFLLIPQFGIIGTGVSLFISMMLTAFMALYISLHLEPKIRFHFGRMFFMCMLFLLLSQSVFAFQNISDIVLRITGKMIFAFLIIILCWYPNKKSLVVIREVINHTYTYDR